MREPSPHLADFLRAELDVTLVRFGSLLGRLPPSLRAARERADAALARCRRMLRSLAADAFRVSDADRIVEIVAAAAWDLLRAAEPNEIHAIMRGLPPGVAAAATTLSKESDDHATAPQSTGADR